MGNNLGGVNLRNYVHFPYHLELGRYASIDATVRYDVLVRRVIRYAVDGSTCVLNLVTSPTATELKVELRDDICSGGGINVNIDKKGENDLLLLVSFRYSVGDNGVMKALKVTETYNPSGGVTKTKVIFYGSGSKGGLLVVEEKRKNGDANPYKVTVAHYYAASSGNVFTQNEIDIGLSILLTIQPSRNQCEFDIIVEGPLQHPSSALFYMFEQVYKTGIWKPLACPHGANQRQMIGSGKFWQSESEDSDSLPPARLRGPKQNATSVLANDGAVRGNNNGNFIVRKLVYGGRY